MSWLGANNRAYRTTPPQGQINFNPGPRAAIGDAKSDKGTSTNTGLANNVITNDVTNIIKGVYVVYDWSQLEGATAGDYSLADNAIVPMLTLCKQNGWDFSVFMNTTANVFGGGVPTYLQDPTTYGGGFTGGGNIGGGYRLPAGDPQAGGVLTRIQEPHVAARLALLVKHIETLCANNGVLLYAFHLTYSETSFSQNAKNNGWDLATYVDGVMKGSNSCSAQLRTACPKLKILVAPTFLVDPNPSLTQAAAPQLVIWYQGVQAYHISSGNYDSTCETGGATNRSYPGDTTFRKVDTSGAAVPGLTDLRGKEDSFCHQSGDSLGSNNGQHGPFTDYSTPVPSADLGDGRLHIVSAHWTQQQISDVWFANFPFIAPKCNNFSQSYTCTKNVYVQNPDGSFTKTGTQQVQPPANYSGCDWDTPGTKVNNGGICGYLVKHWSGGMPQPVKPSNWS